MFEYWENIADGEEVHVMGWLGTYRFYGLTKSGRARVQDKYGTRRFIAPNYVKRLTDGRYQRLNYAWQHHRIKVQYNDGGRAAAGFTNDNTGDCVCASIATATGRKYQRVYNKLLKLSASLRKYYGKRGYHPDHGMNHRTYAPWLCEIGWNYVNIKPVTLAQFAEQHKRGTYIVQVQRHVLVLKNGVYHDRIPEESPEWRKKYKVRGFFSKKKR